MTAVARTWDRLTLPGKALFVLIPLTAVLVTGLVITIALFGDEILDILIFNLPIVRFVFAATVLLLLAPPIAFVIIYMEMKIIALMNLRIGPDRVGPWGSLLSTVHGLKVLMKEDFTPSRADAVVFTWAPVVVFSTMALSALVIPFAPGLFAQDFNLALLYFFAIGGMTVVGLLMGGWASFNKYSLLGGLRSAAQIVSYEIPLTLSVVGLVILAGTLSLNEIVLQQGPRIDPVTGASTGGWLTDWFAFRQPLGFLIFAIAATAEANRTPFDLTEADSEIVAGFATEYSGMRFGFFFFAEYIGVFIISALAVVLFLGGWNAPFPAPQIVWPIDPGSYGLGLLFIVALAPLIGTLLLALPIYLFRSRTRWWVALIIGFVLFNVVVAGALGLWAYINFDWVAGLFWFLGKTFTLVFVFVWLRGTLPRVRIDQLMGFAWKWLLPASLLNLFVTAAAIMAIDAVRGRVAVSFLTGLVPGLGMAKGMALTLRRFSAPKATIMYPEMPADVAAKFRGRLQLLYDEYGGLKCETCFQCAQACPIECIDMGGMDTKGRFHVHWGPPETYGERREELALRRSGRVVPDAAYEHFAPFDLATIDEILEAHDHDPKLMLQILEATQAAFGHLPVAALKRISERTGAWYAMIYGTASYYGHLRFEPPGAKSQHAEVGARRPSDAAYLDSLGASLGGSSAGGRPQ